MVRPGLFFGKRNGQMTGLTRRAVVLSVLAALVAACALSVPVHAAEQAVGLEAQGVDPWAALHNDQGLDIRDAQGHPVSADLIRKQLAAAHEQSVAQAAAVSRLPKARSVFRLLELLNFLGGFWGLPLHAPITQSPLALPLRSRSDKDTAAPTEVIGLAGLCLALLCCRAQTISRRSLQKTTVLRC